MATTVEILLLEDVQGLGRFGQRKKVKMGYARNYLLPGKLALLATKENVGRFESLRKKEEGRRAELKTAAELLAQQLKAIEVSITGKTHDNGKLYGSIGLAEILQALKDQHTIELDKRHLLLTEPFRSVGSYEVTASLHVDVQVPLKVIIASAETK